MKKSFRGRTILAGEFSGEAVVSVQGFDTLVSFQKAIRSGSKTARCADAANREMHNKVLTGKVLCLPRTLGSADSGLVFLTLARLGNGPAAMLFSEAIDAPACSGLILTDVWEGKRIPVIDQLGQEFLETVRDGDILTIHADGKVEVSFTGNREKKVVSVEQHSGNRKRVRSARKRDAKAGKRAPRGILSGAKLFQAIWHTRK
jgi:predicted aconitase with swiveling domain